MPFTSFRIDRYTVQVYANDVQGSVTRWASRVIRLFSADKHVGTAYFAREGFQAPEAAFSDNIIYFHAQAEQYGPVMDLLRHESPVYIAWKPKTDAKEPGDGDAYFYTGQQPTGEEE